jgi:hypothetical protein
MLTGIESGPIRRTNPGSSMDGAFRHPMDLNVGKLYNHPRSFLASICMQMKFLASGNRA